MDDSSLNPGVFAPSVWSCTLIHEPWKSKWIEFQNHLEPVVISIHSVQRTLSRQTLHGRFWVTSCIQATSLKVIFQQESFPAVNSEGKPSTSERVITIGPGVTRKSNLSRHGASQSPWAKPTRNGGIGVIEECK